MKFICQMVFTVITNRGNFCYWKLGCSYYNRSRKNYSNSGQVLQIGSQQGDAVQSKSNITHWKYIYIYISVTQCFLLCILCGFDNITKRELYCQLQRTIISPLCQHGFFMNVCLYVKMTAPIGSKTAMSFLFWFFFI